MNFAWLLLLPVVTTADPATKPVELTLNAAQITLIDEVELAAREAGQIVALPVKEGQMVAEDELIGQIDDTEPQLVKERSQVEAAIAEKLATNNVKVRFARKSHEVAEAELKRARESAEKFAKSVSDTELDRLRLAKERTLLEVEQAEHDQDVARLTQELKETEVHVAERAIERRKVASPLAGMVVELKKRRGEWVQPGDVVARLVRIDRVRAVGFLPSGELTADLLKSPVVLEIDLPGNPKSEFKGTVAYISPEVNPVNGQVRIWAEIENRDLLLRPGLQGRLRIERTPLKKAETASSTEARKPLKK